MSFILGTRASYVTYDEVADWGRITLDTAAVFDAISVINEKLKAMGGAVKAMKCACGSPHDQYWTHETDGCTWKEVTHVR